MQPERGEGREAWTLQHRAWVHRQRLDDALAQLALEQMLIHLDSIERQLAALDARIEQIARSDRWHDQVTRLTAFRGISTCTALGLIAEIGDFGRFSRPRELASYLGITPSEYVTLALMFDAFVSYASEDRAWVDRLQAGLCGRQLDVFVDDRKLRAGDEWPKALHNALTESRHLVLMWSNAARDSDWVYEELSRFRRWMEDAVERGEHSERTIIQVLLEGEFRPLKQYQGIRDVQQADAYVAGADALDDGTWKRIVDAVADGIRSRDHAVPIPVLLLTSTAQRMQAVDPDHEPAGGPSMNDLLQQLEIVNVDQFVACYGQARVDWTPFASGTAVWKILDELRDELNERLSQAGHRRFRWEYVDEHAFWDSEDEAVIAAEAARLENRPSLIVVDPLAFYDELVKDRYSNWLQPSSLGREDTLMLVLAPFSLPARAMVLRAAIRRMARQVFLHYYEPPVVQRASYARCAANIGDVTDFKGWVMSTIVPYVVTTQEQPAAFLRTGAT